MKKYLSKFIILKLYLLTAVIFSQQTSSNPVSISAPTSSPISKFTQVSVSHSTGILDVALPIHILREKG